MRVVSLVPSATEILASIGGLDRLVGRGPECDWPPQVRSLPVLTRQTTSYDPATGVTSARVDRSVREQIHGGGSLYTLDTDLLAELKPDVILTQDLCEVCSIGIDSLRAAIDDLAQHTGHHAEIIAIAPAPAPAPGTIEGVLDDHLAVGRAIGLEDEATKAVFELRGRQLAAESYVNPYTDGPAVGFLEWTDPLFIAGRWTAQMIERAGGRHPLNETTALPDAGAAAGLQAGQRVAGKSIRVPDEVFAASRPERLIISPCGLTFEQAMFEAERLRERASWWADLPAVRSGRVAVVDGRRFSRPGPRLFDAFEWLVGWINDRPELIPEGFPWKQLDDL